MKLHCKRFLRKFKEKNFFNEIEYDKLYLSGSAPARNCGTPKMHKFSSSDSFPKLCPIVSSTGIFNYNIDRFLCDLISPVVLKFFFFLFIKLRIQISRKFLVCYDVSSLFTNILLQETTDIAINPISNHNPNLNITHKKRS